MNDLTQGSIVSHVLTMASRALACVYLASAGSCRVQRHAAGPRQIVGVYKQQDPLLMFTMAVVISALYGGFSAGISATILARYADVIKKSGMKAAD